MKEILGELIKVYDDVEIKEIKSTWFNGKINMPLHINLFRFNFKGWNYLLRYENRVSQFEKIQSITGGMYNSRHIFCFCSSIKFSEDLSKFRIEEVSWLGKLLGRQSNYVLRSKRKILCDRLNCNGQIEDIFNFTNDSEFAPSILGLKEGEDYKIYLNFCTSKLDESLFLKMVNSLVYITNKIDA